MLAHSNDPCPAGHRGRHRVANLPLSTSVTILPLLPLTLSLLVLSGQIGIFYCQNSPYLESFGEENYLDDLEQSYSDRPQNVTLEASSSTSIRVHWTPPYGKSTYGELFGYKIKIKNKNTRKQETISVEPNRHSYELTNLEKGTIYNVRMLAVFNNGTEFGPLTDSLQVETLQKDLDESQVPDKPASIRAKADATSIVLTWNPPKNRNIVVNGYTIGWGMGVPDVFTQAVGSEKRTFTISKLNPSVEYVISLRAHNRMGDGPPIYETVKTAAEAPQEEEPMYPPMELKTTVISSTSVMLDWIDSEANQLDNRWYLVRYTANIHSSAPKYRYLNTTKLNCVIEDLKPNTQYEFAVKVAMNKRNSTWSMSVLNTTFEAVPSTAPRDLTIVSPTDDDPTTINLHWQPPKQPNGQITGYVIFYTTDNTQQDRDWTVKVIIGDKLNAVLSRLQPSSLYYFKIQARNTKGYGPLSTEVSFKTPPAAAIKVADNKSQEISVNLMLVIVLLIGLILIILFVALFKFYWNAKDKAQSIKARKGYLPAATSPSGKNINSRLNNARDLKPPDLWIHGHNDQVELKCIENNKNHGPDSPIGVRPGDNSFAKIKKTNSTYGVNSVLYDDINRPPTSPIDNLGIATMRRSSTLRQSKPSSGCVDHSLSNGIMNLEPSTGLSRPLYPKTQFNLPRTHLNLDSIDSNMAFNSNSLHLYDPVSGPAAHMALTGAMAAQENNLANIHIGMGGSSNNSYISGNSSSPHSVVSNNTVLTNSSTATNITNSSTSPPNTSIYLSNKRPPGPALKSFGVPTPPPPLPSLATLNSLQGGPHPNNQIYNTTFSAMASPSKKFLLTTTNNLNNNMCGSSSTLASNGKTATHFSDDNSISASYNAEDLNLNQEMANLEGLMKDLNAIKSNGLESC